MAMKIPGKSIPVSGAAPAPQTDTPQMEEWQEQRMLPSLLLIGPSGSGKTHGISQLCDAGFRVAYVMVEPKALSVARNRPLIINLCAPIGKRLPTDVERYRRLHALTEALRQGQYRATPNGEPIDILAFDGLTEVADLVLADAEARFTNRASSLDLWLAVGRRTLQFFRDCRDAAGIASTALGLPPIGVVATCLEITAKKLDVQTGKSRIERDQPALQGQMALPRLHSIFEVVWHLDGGVGSSGAHEFQVHTVLTDEHYAKSPAGLFTPIIAGPGGPGNEPNIGAMYRRMIEDEASPYRAGA